MKLLPGPGKPETKTTAHSDQTLKTKSRHHHPTSHFDALHADWKHRSWVKSEGLSRLSSWMTDSWYFELAFLGSLAFTTLLSTSQCSFNSGKGELTEVRGEAQPRPQTLRLASAKGSSSCLCCTASGKQVVETISSPSLTLRVKPRIHQHYDV